MELTDLTVHELMEKVKNKEITIEEITKAYADRINEKEPEVNAFVSTRLDEAIAESRNSEAGIPIGIKDNICTNGIKTTCSSKMLENFVSPYDATVITKIKENNMPILGKLNTGGSSGGSAAAVAANLVPWALGSDTGGSIREPASFCGIVGLKPTYGLVSRSGLVAFASSLDQIGPMTKDVEDSALLLNIIAGHDENDSTSVKREKIDYTKNLKNSIQGMKIGVPKEFFGEGINPEVKKSLENSIEEYKKLGAIVEECSLDVSESSLAAYYIIACAEASSNLGRFDGIRYGYRAKDYKDLKELFVKSRTEGFGKEVKRRIILGTYVLSSGYYDAFYKKAQKVRTYVKNKFDECFKKYDVLLTPVAPTTAFDIGSKTNNPLEMYLADICTVSINIASVPAISIPCGVDSNNMPIGMQLIGNRFQEEKILNAAYAIEQQIKFRENYKPEFKK